MRIQVDPKRVELALDQPFTVAVTITNTSTLIGGYHLRILGADPNWVTLEAENLSLFPDTSQTVHATIRIPAGVGAGDRRIAVQVRELTPPQAIAVAEIELVVPAREAMKLALTPLTVVCGRTGRFGVIAENTGNIPVTVVPIGLDPESKSHFEFVPAVLNLAPGEHVITDMRATARRRWFGTPVVRPFSLATAPVEALGTVPPLAAPPIPVPLAAQPGDADPHIFEPPPKPPKPLAQGTMLQKARLSRGALSLISLLLAVSIFAIVITIAMSKLVGVSAADRDLAIQVASARSGGAGTGSSTLGGEVKLLTNGSPAAGVGVELFAAGDLTNPVITTATNDKGAWAVSALPAGAYKVRFRGAGFSEIWYPNALTGADAQSVQLQAGQTLTNLQVALGGLRATVSGQVLGTDVAGAVLTIEVPAANLQPVTRAPAVPSAPAGTETAQPVPAAGGTSPTPPGLRCLLGAVLDEAPVTGGPGAPGVPGVQATGGVPATGVPGVPGDQPTGGVPTTGVPGVPGVQPTAGVPAAGGPGAPAGAAPGVQAFGGAAGAAAGVVSSPVGPGGGAVLETLPIGSDGTFSVSDLPSPAVYDLIVSKVGFATDTARIDLSGGESRAGIVLRLRTGDGLISGSISGPDGPLAKAVVTATTGTNTVSTVSLSTGAVGTFTLRGLITPATYTVTVSLQGYTTVTSTINLTSAQKLTGMQATLSHAAGSLAGHVTTLADNKPAPGVTVTVTSGAVTLTTVTQSTGNVGAWTMAGLALPGTYTVTFSRADLQSQTVAVALNAAGQLTSGGAGGATAVDAGMRSAFAIVSGVVRAYQ